MAAFYEGFLITGPTPGPDGMLSVTLEFRKDNAPTITQNLRSDVFTLAWLKQFVINKCAALNTPPDTVAAGKIDTTVTPPVVDAVAQAWAADDARYWQLKRYVDDGLVNATDTPTLWTAWTNLVSRRKANFKPAYLG